MIARTVLATEAGAEVMHNGGNAVDAAVAAALTLGVVDCNNSGLGGGCLILIRSEDGRITAVDGREMGPRPRRRACSSAMARRSPGASQTGPLAVGALVLLAYQLAIVGRGTMKLEQLLRPGIERAANGFPIGRQLASAIADTASDLRKFPGAGIFLHPDGSPLREGERLVQPDLARTYRQIAEDGVAWFYRGPVRATSSAIGWRTTAGC